MSGSRVADHSAIRCLRRIGCAAAALSIVLASGPSLASGGFPLREQYPDLNFIETEELADQYHDFLVVDVRSEGEYNVIRMLGAEHVPLAFEKTFISSLEKAAGSPSRLIAMYCNGITCAKSYKATRKAREAGFANVRVYDAGIMEWAKAQPDKTALLGKAPLDPSKLLSNEDLEARLLPYDAFVERASRPEAIVFDIREAVQRKEIKDLPGVESQKVPLTLFANYVNRKRFKDKVASDPVYIFDAVGRQVRWIQYYLEANDIEHYYFLEKGVAAMISPASASH